MVYVNGGLKNTSENEILYIYRSIMNCQSGWLINAVKIFHYKEIPKSVAIFMEHLLRLRCLWVVVDQ